MRCFILVRAGWPVFLLLGALVLPLVLGAQAPAAPPSIRAEANYVRVDLYATLNGSPVTDLRREELELLDEGVPQTIDRFEHVLLATSRPQAVGPDPASAITHEVAQRSRDRVLVLFLDSYHVDGNWSRSISRPLADALNRTVGGDDLIAVMTPHMRARDLTFSRRTTTIDNLLAESWGARDRSVMATPEEAEYAVCYPGVIPSDQGIAQQMILRRREVETLDALEALVDHLGTIREGRKAVITISNGWRLFGENAGLRRPIGDEPPPLAPLAVDGRTGRLTTDAASGSRVTARCESDRLALSRLRNEARFRGILDRANRTNTSFYPIDPRRAAVFDEDIVPAAGVGLNPAVVPDEDLERLAARETALQMMADLTDGFAIVRTSDMDASLDMVVDDLSSYYLLGYYTTQRLDGRFHSITVRITRPGVDVRARRGYLAVPPATTGPATSADSPAGGAAGMPLAALSAVLERPLAVQAAAGWTADDGGAIWVVTEARGQAGRREWIAGATVQVSIIDRDGAAVAIETHAIEPGTTVLRVRPGAGVTLVPGEYQVLVRAAGASVGSQSRVEGARVLLPPSPAGSGALFSRRGVTTGNRLAPTADLQYRRTEWLVMEVPAAAGEPGSARLLDRSGIPLAVPLATAIREDAAGSRWRTVELRLAPLAQGDYVIEVTAGSERTLAAFRVVP